MITVSRYDKLAQKLNNLGRVFQKTNRILSGRRDITVMIKQTQDNPAACAYPAFTSDSKFIYINWDQFGPIEKKETLIELLGANYHELCHILFTPKVTYNNTNRLAFNILEDQRIESLFTAMYEPSGKYFTQMILRVFLSDMHQWSSAFIFLYGRTYLPLEIRQEFESRFELSDLIPEIKQLIDEYKGFTASEIYNNTARVSAVVTRFAQIMLSLNDLPKDNCQHITMGGNQRSVDTEREQNAMKKEKQRRDKEEETGEDQSGFWDEEDDSAEEEPDDSEAADSDGEGDEDDDHDEDASEGSAEDDGDSGADNSSDNSDGGDESEYGDSDSDDEDGSVEAGASDDTEIFDDADLADYLDDINDAIRDDVTVNEEVSRVREAVNDVNNIDTIPFGDRQHNLLDVSVGVLSETRRIVREYRKLLAQVEPGWKYGSDHGKLNVSRAMHDPTDFENIFDEWEEGREQDMGVEAVIALDTSISMAGDNMRQASEVCWAIKRSLDEIDAKTTVLGFDWNAYGLLSRGERVHRSKFQNWTELGGSTEPSGCFEICRQVLNASPLPNKLFVIITDGGWGSGYYKSNSPKISNGKAIELIPGTRMYVGIGPQSYVYNRESHEHFHIAKNIGQISELTDMVSEAVKTMLRQRI